MAPLGAIASDTSDVHVGVGETTVIIADPVTGFFPPVDAVMTTGPPGAIPVTRPVAETVAIRELLDDQRMVMAFFWSEPAASSWRVEPAMTEASEGVTVKPGLTDFP